MKIKNIALSILETLKSVAAIFCLLLLWEIAPRLQWVDPFFIPPLSSILVAFWHLILSGEWEKLALVSLKRVFIGYSISVVIALPLGFIIGWFKRCERILNPLLQALRQVNATTILPLFILMFGIGEVSKISIIAYSGIWSVFMNTINGVKNVDPLLIKCAKSLKLSNWQIFRKVAFPAALPSVFTGLRYGITIALLLLISAEMLGGTSGIGYAINNWQMLSKAEQMWSGILTMVIFGLVFNYSFIALEKRMSRWKEDAPRG
ncbi:MAG: ABC transporter permease [Peptococcaceae bacterium]|jgi:NitT/TauT family transport system permease protein|nr:ABC transporter permease [Peptococcaceae bacterium]